MKVGSPINIYDKEKQEYIAKNISRIDATNILGISTRDISTYLKTGYSIGRRYLITLANKEEGNSVGDNAVYSFPIELLTEWDKWRIKLNPNAKPTGRILA